jgi:3-methyladenine DNA glycosylase AlkD
MLFDDVIALLQDAGSEQTRKTYRRHGVQDPMFGVSWAMLRPLAKKIGRDQRLSEELWKTGNFDCRALATLIADPQTIKKATLNAWAKDGGVRCVSGDMARIITKTPWAAELSSKWCGASRESEQALGWSVIAVMAMEEPESDDVDELLAACVDVIESKIHSSLNYTRYAMNGALIAIGGRNAALKKRALAAAKSIGKVEVDHGDTDCKTPDATAYIAKIWVRKAAQTGGKAKSRRASRP